MGPELAFGLQRGTEPVGVHPPHASGRDAAAIRQPSVADTLDAVALRSRAASCSAWRATRSERGRSSGGTKGSMPTATPGSVGSVATMPRQTSSVGGDERAGGGCGSGGLQVGADAFHVGGVGHHAADGRVLGVGVDRHHPGGVRFLPGEQPVDGGGAQPGVAQGSVEGDLVVFGR